MPTAVNRYRLVQWAFMGGLLHFVQ